jgi:probable FeS assembly SUF system protein SufT
MSEPVTLTRDCEAIAIPSGVRELIPKGQVVRVTQVQGDSATLLTPHGQQYRISSADADALGLVLGGAPPSPQTFSEQAVWDQLRTIFDPEIPVNIVDLGLVYSCEIGTQPEGHTIKVAMTMTAPGCGMADVLKADVERRLVRLPGVAQVVVDVVFTPPWHPGRMSDAAKLQLGLDVDSDSDSPSLPMFGRSR